MPEYTVGQPVRILDGGFQNFVGVVRQAPATGPIQVAVSVHGRETLVDVHPYWLEVIR